MAEAAADLFSGLAIERSEEPLPKRLVAGREALPNPFVDVVKQSYDEAKQVGQDKAVRAIYVPFSAKDVTVRTVGRKDKNGKVTAQQWQQAPNVTTAMYLLRQAAQKHDIGVRIVVDYDTANVDGVTVKMTEKDGDKEVTREHKVNGVTLHKFRPQSSGPHRGRVRVRFVGTKKKETKKEAPEANDE